MAAASIIARPGIMTGQVLAGIDPLDAAKNQIVLAFVLSTAASWAVSSSRPRRCGG